MAKLDERVVLIEELPFTLDDYEQMFGGSNRRWAYRWYHIVGVRDSVLLVAYESLDELEEKEKDR